MYSHQTVYMDSDGTVTRSIAMHPPLAIDRGDRNVLYSIGGMPYSLRFIFFHKVNK